MAFRVIVAGSRTFRNYGLLCKKLDRILSNKQDVVIISGGARGADAYGEQYAHEHNLGLEVYPADWNKYGKSAGYRRNEQMAEVADALVAFWDGESRGTKNMIDLMGDKPVRVIYF